MRICPFRCPLCKQVWRCSPMTETTWLGTRAGDGNGMAWMRSAFDEGVWFLVEVRLLYDFKLMCGECGRGGVLNDC